MFFCLCCCLFDILLRYVLLYFLMQTNFPSLPSVHIYSHNDKSNWGLLGQIETIIKCFPIQTSSRGNPNIQTSFHTGAIANGFPIQTSSWNHPNIQTSKHPPGAIQISKPPLLQGPLLLSPTSYLRLWSSWAIGQNTPAPTR